MYFAEFPEHEILCYSLISQNTWRAKYLAFHGLILPSNLAEKRLFTDSILKYEFLRSIDQTAQISREDYTVLS
jgi:hypothetical protein